VVYTAEDGSRIVTRGVENVEFTELPGGDNSGFVMVATLGPNSIRALNINIQGDTATLTEPGTDFTFTGINGLFGRPCDSNRRFRDNQRRANDGCSAARRWWFEVVGRCRIQPDVRGSNHLSGLCKW